MCRAGSQGVGFDRDHIRPGMDEDQSVALAGTEEANVAATTVTLKILFSLIIQIRRASSSAQWLGQGLGTPRT